MIKESSIKEVRQLTGITDHALRYYEKAGLLKDIRRRSGGQRYYSEQDIEWIKIILLLRGTGMPIQKILILAGLKDRGAASLEDRIAYFTAYCEELQAQIDTRQAAIVTIQAKVALHKQMLLVRDKK